MADKRLEKEEEQQAEDARSEIVNEYEDHLNDLEDEEEEAAEDAETSAL